MRPNSRRVIAFVSRRHRGYDVRSAFAQHESTPCVIARLDVPRAYRRTSRRVSERDDDVSTYLSPLNCEGTSRLGEKERRRERKMRGYLDGTRPREFRRLRDGLHFAFSPLVHFYSVSRSTRPSYLRLSWSERFVPRRQVPARQPLSPFSLRLILCAPICFVQIYTKGVARARESLFRAHDGAVRGSSSSSRAQRGLATR